MGPAHPTRRDFLKQGMIVTAAAAIANASSPAPAESRSGPFKLGIIGCGNRSKAHITALNSVADIEVAALCDVLPHKMDQRAQLIKNRPAPRKFTDIDKMLAEGDLDAVAIVLPNHLHKMAAIAAFGAKKHVFCEKPMALTVADCNEIMSAAKSAGKALQIGTQRRHASSYKKAIETIRNANIGKILSSGVNSYRGDWRVPDKDEYPTGVPYWRLDQKLCGGVVYEMGAHIIDVNNWIFDSEPVMVVSLQGVNDLELRKRDSTDHGGVLVRYANDALMNYGGNLYTYGPPISGNIFATNATVAISDEKLAITYGHAKGMPSKEKLPDPLSLDMSGGDGTDEQWHYFAKVLAGTAPAYPDGIAGRQSIQICQGAIISAQEKRIVEVKELG